MSNNLERIEEAVQYVIKEHDFLNIRRHVRIAERVLTDDVTSFCPICCTDGKVDYYNEDFVSRLSDEQIRHLVVHLGYHRLFFDVPEWKELKKESMFYTNAAVDCLIYSKICKTDSFKNGDVKEAAPTFFYKPSYDKLTVPEIFELVKEEYPNHHSFQMSDGSIY